MAFVPMDLSGGSRSITLPAPERHLCCLFPFLRRPPVKGPNERTSISSAQCRQAPPDCHINTPLALGPFKYQFRPVESPLPRTPAQ